MFLILYQYETPINFGLKKDKTFMRLGLDIGTNSIGWWLYKTAPNKGIIEHIAGGVRIFSDGRKNGDPLNLKRREARSSRRMRDRYLTSPNCIDGKSYPLGG